MASAGAIQRTPDCSVNHLPARLQAWTYDPEGNRTSQDRTQVRVRSLTNRTQDAADHLVTETAAGGSDHVHLGRNGEPKAGAGAGRRGVTTYTWNSENRLLEIGPAEGSRNTMLYHRDGLRTKPHDSAGDTWMARDAEGSSGYQDLLDERQPGASRQARGAAAALIAR